MLLYTIILSKYLKYTATLILEKLIVHLLLSSSSVQTAYRKTGISNRSNSFTKIIYTGAYMILDAHTFTQCCQTPGLQPLFSCLVRCQTHEVSLCIFCPVRHASCCFKHCVVFSATLLLCVGFFEPLTVAGNWTCCCIQ